MPEAMVAVELDGGIFSGGRHSGGIGQVDDMHKCNAALLLGWRVFHLTNARTSGSKARDPERRKPRHNLLGDTYILRIYDFAIQERDRIRRQSIPLVMEGAPPAL